MKVGREDAAVETDATVQKPVVVIAAAVGAAEGAVAAMGGGAPSAVTAPAAVAVVEPAVGSRWRRRWRWIWRSRGSRGSASSTSSSTTTTRRPSSLLRKCRTRPSSSTTSSRRYYSEANEDMDDSKESRDSKSLYGLGRLWNGEIPYLSGSNRLYRNIDCPFCCMSIKSDYDSLIMHGTGIGRGNGRNRKPHVRAKHAAFGAFLRKYAKGHLPFYLPRPPRPAKMPWI
ncbi:hypothetical protein VPH35_086181 [Triticum aestivum]